MKKTTIQNNDVINARVVNNQTTGVKVYQKFNKTFIDRDDRTFYIESSSLNTIDKGIIALVELHEYETEILMTRTYDVKYDVYGNKCSNNRTEEILDLLQEVCEGDTLNKK